MADKNMRIVFMGTPDFAVESLKTLVDNNYTIVGVVTAPDRPAGRGQKIKQSPVKEYAVSQNIPVLQPEKLKNQEFTSFLLYRNHILKKVKENLFHMCQKSLLVLLV